MGVQNNKNPMVVGIDPDIEASGVAIILEGKIEKLIKMTFFELIKFIDENQLDAFFIVENVELHSSLYAIHIGKNSRVREKIAQNVGKVKAVCRLIEEFLIQIDANFVLAKPIKGFLKKTKKDKLYFNQLTGWNGNSSEDTRDAAIIALFGDRHNKKKLKNNQHNRLK